MRILHLIDHGLGHLPTIDFDHQVTDAELLRFGTPFEQTLLRQLIKIEVVMEKFDRQPIHELIAAIMPEKFERGGHNQSAYGTLEERLEGGYAFTNAGNCGRFVSFYVIDTDEAGVEAHSAGSGNYFEAYDAFKKGGEQALADWCSRTIAHNVQALLLSVSRHRNEARNKAEYLWRKETALARLKRGLSL